VRYSHRAWWDSSPAVAGRQRGHDEFAVAVVAGACGFGRPGRVQDGQVVGVSQVAVPGFGGGEFGTVAAEYVGQYGDRLARLRCARTRCGLVSEESLLFVPDTVVAPEFGGGPGAGPGVGGACRGGEHAACPEPQPWSAP